MGYMSKGFSVILKQKLINSFFFLKQQSLLHNFTRFKIPILQRQINPFYILEYWQATAKPFKICQNIMQHSQQLGKYQVFCFLLLFSLLSPRKLLKKIIGAVIALLLRDVRECNMFLQPSSCFPNFNFKFCFSRNIW